jgi:hypothetical protein
MEAFKCLILYSVTRCLGELGKIKWCVALSRDNVIMFNNICTGLIDGNVRRAVFEGYSKLGYVQ